MGRMVPATTSAPDAATNAAANAATDAAAIAAGGAAMLATEGDWVARLADEVIAEADRRAPGVTIVCASGISPSGPIHLGNLREVLTPHFVADEIRRRGRDVVHLLSWDDFDRFRRVPAGINPAW